MDMSESAEIESTTGTGETKAPASHVGDVNQWGRRFDGFLWFLTDEPKDRVPTEYEGNPIPPNIYCRGWNGKPSRMKYCKNPAGAYTDHLGEGRCKFHGGTALITHGLERRYALATTRIGEFIEKHEEDADPLDILPEISLLRSLTEDHVERHARRSEELSAWHSQRRLNPEQQNAMYQLIDDYEAVSRSLPEITTRQVELPRLAREAVKHLGDDIPRPSQVPDLAEVVKLISETTRSVERVFTMRAKAAITYEQLKRFLFAMDRMIELRLKDQPELLAQVKTDILGIGI